MLCLVEEDEIGEKGSSKLGKKRMKLNYFHFLTSTPLCSSMEPKGNNTHVTCVRFIRESNFSPLTSA